MYMLFVVYVYSKCNLIIIIIYIYIVKRKALLNDFEKVVKR